MLDQRDRMFIERIVERVAKRAHVTGLRSTKSIVRNAITSALEEVDGFELVAEEENVKVFGRAEPRRMYGTHVCTFMLDAAGYGDACFSLTIEEALQGKSAEVSLSNAARKVSELIKYKERTLGAPDVEGVRHSKSLVKAIKDYTKSTVP